MPDNFPGGTAVHARRWWVLVVLCLSVLLVAIDNTIVNVALPTLSHQLNASTTDLQWVADAYTLIFAGLLLVGGNLGDRWGRKWTLQLGLVLFALASWGAASAGTTGQLIATRAAMGLGSALIYPTTLALISVVFTDRGEKAMAIGIWSGVSGLAIALGPVSGGVLLEHFSWSSIFLVNIPVVVLALVAGAKLVPESRDPATGTFDLVGAVLSVATIGSLVWTVIEAPVRGWRAPLTISGFAAALVLLAAFIWWESRRSEPLLEMAVFRNRRFSAASTAIGLAFFGLFGFVFVITQFFQFTRGYSTLQAGVATLPFAVVVGSLSPVAILLTKRLGTKFVVTAGLLLMCAGFTVAGYASVDAAYWGSIVLAMVLMAAGLALTTGPATDAIMGSLPAAKAGVGSAVNDTTREVGGALGIAVIGSVMSSFYGSRLAGSWGDLGVPAQLTAQAKESVGAGLGIAARLPAELARPVTDAAKQAFMHGLNLGSLTAAVVAFVAAIAAWSFLPVLDVVQEEVSSSSAPAVQR